MRFHSRCSLRHSQGERHLVVGNRLMKSMELLHWNNDEQREMMSPLTSNFYVNLQTGNQALTFTELGPVMTPVSGTVTSIRYKFFSLHLQMLPSES